MCLATMTKSPPPPSRPVRIRTYVVGVYRDVKYYNAPSGRTTVRTVSRKREKHGPRRGKFLYAFFHVRNR